MKSTPINPRKDIPVRKGPPAINWAPVHNHRLAAAADSSLPCTPCKYQRKAADGASNILRCVPVSELTLIRDFLESYFNRPKPALSNQIYAAMSSFTYLLTNQSSSITTNQDAQFQPIRTVLMWTNLTVQIQILHLHKNGPIRGQGGHLIGIKGLLFVLAVCAFGFPERLFFCFAICSPE